MSSRNTVECLIHLIFDQHRVLIRGLIRDAAKPLLRFEKCAGLYFLSFLLIGIE